jgi:ATP-binding cassette subfamily B protein
MRPALPHAQAAAAPVAPARLPHSLAEAKALAADFFQAFTHAPRALRLAWQTSPRLLLGLLIWTLVAGAVPSAIAWVGRGLVDAVVHAQRGGPHDAALRWVGVELALVLLLLVAQRSQLLCQSLLRAQLGHVVHVQIFDKALTLSMPQFEDSKTYDLLTRARREASTRPLGLIVKLLNVLQNAVSLMGFSALLLSLSPWAVLALALAGLPAFLAEARFSGEAFRLFRYRAPETRMQLYLETLMAREDSAKEVKIFQFGPRLLQRYREIYQAVYEEDRTLTWKRHNWGLLLAILATLVLYGAFAWLALATAAGKLTLGMMTAGLLAFKQGQQAFGALLQAIGGLYEDNLYISTLFELLDLRPDPEPGAATSGPNPQDGLHFEDVGFTYPGADSPALEGVNLHVTPGQTLALVGANGSGKTTLIKLLTRLYAPTHGRILLDGRDLQEWQPDALRRRVGVIFQDFLRYQFLAGENIGVGDERHYEDETRWQDAAEHAAAHDTLAGLPQGYRTQLGKWFDGGRELSGGQWQRVALARAFMRTDAQILVLDEPTSAMDASAEVEIFDRLQDQAKGRMSILISHRFSTVRRADHIAVLDGGRITEQGSHVELLAAAGTYARLFEQQAQGYR